MMPLSKFEEMLKTNQVYFFDTTEFEEIIHHYLDQGNTTMAKKAVSLALEQHPDAIDIKLIQAEIMMFEQKLDEAEVLLNDLQAIHPSHDEVYIQIANLHSKRDEHVKAINFLRKAKEFSEDLADVSSLLGMEYLYLDNYKEAIECFSVCLEDDVDDYQALYNVIYCFEMESQYQEAINYLNKYLDKNPYSEVAWHQIGRQYFVLENYKEALKAFDYAVLIDELFIGAYIEKAKTLEKLERFDEAIENYKITLGLDDPTSYVYLRVGECYKKKDDYAKAVYYYKKALHEDPLLDKGWMLLAVISSENQEFDKALHYVNKAIALDETNMNYWKIYAEVNYHLHFFEETVEAFQKCIDLGDSGVEMWTAIADIYALEKKYEMALQTLIKAKMQHSNFAEIEYRLGCMFFMIHKNEEAYLHLKTALHLNFEYYKTIQDIYPLVFEDEEVKRMVYNILDQQ